MSHEEVAQRRGCPDQQREAAPRLVVESPQPFRVPLGQEADPVQRGVGVRGEGERIEKKLGGLLARLGEREQCCA